MTKRFQFLIATLMLAGCAGTSPEIDPDYDVRPGLVIATDATFAPFHYFDDRLEITGFDIELARLLAERAGFVPSVIAIPYENLFDDLLVGSYDVVAATTGITPEREAKYLFTAPYYNTCQAALVRTGDDEPRNLADLKGRRVGASGAGTSILALEDLTESEQVLLSTGEATETIIQEDGSVPVLEDGTIDALIVDEMDAVESARASNGRFRVLSEPVALEQYAMVLAPNRRDLKQRLDRALKELRDDGTLAELERQFGLDRGEDWPIKFPR
jgi:ABC-type amino acid transport substrate-binding protein